MRMIVRALAGPLFCGAFLGLIGSAAAQAPFPNRTLTIIVPAPPGGPTDAGARIIGRGLSEALGQPVVTENKPGAGTIVGTAFVARAQPDGYTLGALTNAGLTSPFAVPGREVPYKLEDLTLLGIVCFDYTVIAGRPDARWQSIGEVMAFAKANPRKIAYGAAGVGSMGQLGMEFVNITYGADLVFVPYTGSAPSIAAVMGGHVDLSAATASASIPLVASGKIRALAVTSPRRLPALPDVPTVGEAAGKGDPPNFFLAIAVPSRTPAAIVDRLTRTLARVAQDKSTIEQLERAGITADYRSPEATQKLIADELKVIAQIAKSADLK